MFTNRYLGQSRIGSTSTSNKGTPISVPKHGSINEEDTGVPVRKSRSNIPGGFAVGRDTLHGNAPRSKAEVSTENFYGGSDRANMASMVAGTPKKPAVRRLPMHQSPDPQDTPIQADPPRQSRDARQHSAQKTRTTQSSTKGKNSETITISDSEEEGDTTKGCSARRTSSNSPVAGRKENIYGIAAVSGKIRRKSDSPTDTRSLATNAAIYEQKLVHQIVPKRDASTIAGPSKDSLEPLPSNRTFHFVDQGPEKFEQPQAQASLSGRMKDRNGIRNSDKNVNKSIKRNGNPTIASEQSRREFFVNNIPPSIAKKSSNAPSKSQKDASGIKQAQISERRTMKLEKISFLGLGQVWNHNEDYWLEWRLAGTLTIKGRHGKQDLSLTILDEDVEQYVVCEDKLRPLIQLVLKNPKEIKQRLFNCFGNNEIVNCESDESDTFSIVMLFFTNFDDSFCDDKWSELVDVLKGKPKYVRIERNASLLLESGAKNLPPIELKELPTKSKNQREESTNSSGATVKANNGATRSSLRQEILRTVSEERERAASGRIEKKDVAISKGRQTKKFQYPFEETIGAVAVFPSDIEKLNDQEMLNDTIVEFGLKYLLEQIKERDADLYSQIYVFSSFFYKRMSESKRDRKQNYTFVKKWTKKVDIFRKKYLVVPINENMHWYLAIITNPFFAVKESEKERGLYTSADEADVVDENLKKAEKVEEDGKEEEEISETDEQGDVHMEECRRPSVEAMGASLSQETIREEPVKDENAEKISPPFRMASTPELQQNFAPKSKLYTFPVLDKRLNTHFDVLPRTPKQTSDMEMDLDTDDEIKYIRSTSAKKTTPRAGLTDGIKNVGGGKILGGGKEPFVIIPGTSFDKEDDSTIGTKKRKLVHENGDVHSSEEEKMKSARASPSRSRSGAMYSGKSSGPSRLSGEEMQEKLQAMLEEKAMICIFDSMGSTHKAVRNTLREYLCLEYNDKRGGNIEVENVQVEHIDVKFPTQSNFCDCGLYLLHAFERFFYDPKGVMKEIIPKRDRNDSYWLAEEAAQKRQWWRALVESLSDQFSSNAANHLAARNTRLALKREEAEKNEGQAAATATATATTTSSSTNVDKDMTTDDDDDNDDDDARSVSKLTNIQGGS